MVISSAVGDLAARAVAGDATAFELLISQHLTQAHRLAFGVLHDNYAAEDAVQEAALKAWRRLGNLRPGSELGPWFLAIVVNECRTQLRRRWWRVLRVPELPAPPVADQERAMTGADLRRDLARLPPDARVAIVLHFYLDLSIDEVARVTGVSPAAARSRIYRGLKRLRPSFEESLQ